MADDQITPRQRGGYRPSLVEQDSNNTSFGDDELKMLLKEASSLKTDKKSKTRLESTAKRSSKAIPQQQEQVPVVSQSAAAHTPAAQQQSTTSAVTVPEASVSTISKQRKLTKQPSSADYATRQLEQELLLERVQHGRTRQQLDEMTESVMAWSLECKQMQAELEALRSQRPETVIVEKKPSFTGFFIRALFFGGLGATATWFLLKHNNKMWEQ